MPYKIIDHRRESGLLRLANGRQDSPLHAAGRGLLSLGAEAYRLGQAHRAATMSRRPVDCVDVPVISVGNITVGGTGKTPVCLFLADGLHRADHIVGVATRGYGKKSAGAVVATRDNLPKSWEAVGDEPMMMLNSGLVQAVAVDTDRARAAAGLATTHRCTVILLDDGFQFVTLHRDWNIVTLDAARPFGNGRLLPRGPLREPADALARADLFWLTRAHAATEEELEQTRATLAAAHPDTPQIVSAHVPRHIINLAGNGFQAPDTLQNKKLCTVCGIAAPESFEHTVETLTNTPVAACRYSDHYAFSVSELNNVDAFARRQGCDAVITTEKDAVRAPAGFTPALPWLVLGMGLEILDGQEHVKEILDSLE